MTFGPTNAGKLRNVKKTNVILANQNTESFVFRWLRALAMFDVACFAAFVGRHFKRSIDTIKGLIVYPFHVEKPFSNVIKLRIYIKEMFKEKMLEIM